MGSAAGRTRRGGDGGGRLALTSGALLALSFPPVPFSPAPFLVLLPLAFALEGLPDRRGATVRAAGWGALAFGAGWGVLLLWTGAALSHRPWLGALAYLALVTCFAVVGALVTAAAHRMRARVGMPSALALPLAWVAGDWVRGHLGPWAFPWLPLPVALTAHPGLLALTPWVGTTGVTLWMLLPQGAWAGLLASRASRARWVAAAVASAVWFAAVLLPGRHPLPAQGTTLSLAILQLDLPAHAPVRERADSALARASRWEPTERYDLVLLPEGSLPVDVARSPTVVAPLQELARRAGAPVLVGGLGRAADGADARPTNSVFRIDADGLSAWRYDKRRLVPIIERASFLQPGRGYAAGREPGLTEVGGVRVGVLICYESIFPELTRALAREGADLIVNLTNDAWYREPGPGALGLEQHPAHLVLRALETGRPVVRVANTGPSFAADANGRVGSITALRVQDVLSLRIAVAPSSWTRSTRWGDVPGLLATLAVLLLLVLSGRSRAVESAPRFH